MMTVSAPILAALLFQAGDTTAPVSPIPLSPCGIYRDSTQLEPCRQDTALSQVHYREPPVAYRLGFRLESMLGIRGGLPIHATKGHLQPRPPSLAETRIEIPFLLRISYAKARPWWAVGLAPLVVEWSPWRSIASTRAGSGIYFMILKNISRPFPLGLTLKTGWESVQQSELSLSMDLAIGYPWHR